jgi:hypothetical protein
MKYLAMLTFIVVLGAQLQTADGHGIPVIVTVNGNHLQTDTTGYRGDLLPVPGLLFDQIPGYLIQGPAITANESIGFSVMSHLLYWDGSQLATPPNIPGTSNSEVLSFQLSNGPPNPLPTVNIDRNSGFQTGFVFDTGPAVDMHGITYFMSDVNAPIGEYGVVVRLTSSVHGPSNPFVLAFNNGLGDGPADIGLDAMAALVPEPSTVLLLATGIAFCAAAGLRKRLAKSGKARQ